MSEINEMVQQLLDDADEFEASDPVLAAELRAIADSAQQYALRDDKHQAIIAEAKLRKQNGEDLDVIHRDSTAKLLETWPDAEAYGNALVQLRLALLEDK